MSDRITLTGLAATARHGVLDFEKQIPQPFVLDIGLDVDLRAAGESDDLEASLSYADVAARAIEVCSGEPVDLIETLAARIAADPIRARDRAHDTDPHPMLEHIAAAAAATAAMLRARATDLGR